MSIYSAYYSLIDLFFNTLELTTLSFSTLFVIASFASRRITHIIQAIVLAGIAIYNSFSVAPIFTYLSMYMMTLSAPFRIFDIVWRGIITDPLIIKFVLFFVLAIIIIWIIMAVGMLGFFAISALGLDPVFDLFGEPHNRL
jgi:hypothetical protein